MLKAEVKISGLIPGTNIPVPDNLLRRDFECSSGLVKWLEEVIVKNHYEIKTLTVVREDE